jgi:DNA-binding NarL/FixJ family response regulator
MGLRVLIADEDELARALMKAIVERDGGLELVASAENADRAIELAGEHLPDVAVLDWVMPGGGGAAAAREILLRSPDTRIVALTTSDTGEAATDPLRDGARSSLAKGSPPEELLRTIRAAADDA